MQLAVLTVKRRDNSPSAARQRINGVLFSSGLLFEGLELLERLRPHFGQLPRYRDDIGPLLAATQQSGLRGALRTVRNESVAHFGHPKSLRNWGKRLEGINSRFVQFLVGDSAENGRTYYVLADECAIQGLLGQVRSPEEVGRRMAEVGDLSGRFLDTAENLIADVLDDFQLRRDRPYDRSPSR